MKIEAMLLGLLAVCACAGPTLGGSEGGNLVVVRVGDGKTTPGRGWSAPVFLDEMNPATGAVVRSIALPTESGTSDKRLTLSFSATSEGMLWLSDDGHYLTLAGYDAPMMMAKVASSPSDAVSRVVARVDASGRVDTTSRIGDGYSGNNVRGAVTVDGRRFYVAGAGAGGGTRLVELGSPGTSILLGEVPDNTRGVGIFDGQLYASTASGNLKGIVAVGRGVPVEPGQASTLVAPSPGPGPEPEPKPDRATPAVPPPPPREPKPSGFVFLGGRLYVADLEFGLLEYEPDGAVGDGPARYRLKSGHEFPGLAFLTGRLVGGTPVLYGTDGVSLLQFVVDGAKFRSAVVAKAGAGQFFRGVAFAPAVLDGPSVPLPVVVALGAAGLIIPSAAILTLRRKARRRIRHDGTDILTRGGPV